MELIGIEMSEFTHRSRSLLLHHSDLALDRSLGPGERVILWDAVGNRYYAGSVADVRPSSEADDNDGTADVDYRFEIGICLPEEIALDRITDSPSSTPALGTREIFALLRQLGEHLPVPGAAGGLALDS